MNSLLTTKWRDLGADEHGNFAIFSALAAPPILIVIAAGVSYSNAVTLRAKTQAAADSAVLAASVAYANGQATSAAQAQTIAAHVFKLNAPASAQAAGDFTPVATIANSTITTTGSFSGTVPSLISSVVGDLSISVNAAASSSLAGSGAGGARGSKGSFTVSGDPHFYLGSTLEFSSACQLTGKPLFTSFYSDYQLQVNAQCWLIQTREQAATTLFDQMVADLGPRAHPSANRLASLWDIAWNSVPEGDLYGVQGYAVQAAGHKISFSFPGSNPFSWTGEAVVDGKTFPWPGDAATILDDKAASVKLVMNRGPSLTLTTPQYSILFSPDEDSIGMYVTMNSGAVCGTPGGLLGQLWGQQSLWNTNYLDFDISQWGQDAQYSTTCGAMASAASPRTKLIR